MKNVVVVLAVLVSFPIVLFAWGNDSVGPPKYRFSVSVQGGQPNRLLGIERTSLDDVPYHTGGNLQRSSYGTGVTFRYFTDETFFLHLRFAYSSRHLDIYDSTTVGTDEFTLNNIHETHQFDQVYYENYNVRNVLIGIGGGHEGNYGRFLVRAGAEVGFIKYTMNEHYDRSGSFDRGDHDSLANGNQYRYDLLRGASTYTEYPLAWAIGLSGHATLQYKVSEHFGIGATLYLGGFYSGMKNAHLTLTYLNIDRKTDSNGLDYNSDDNTVRNFEYTTRQFDFSPLNGQISLEYYFWAPRK